MFKLNIKNTVFAIFAGAALALAGCATAPDFGDQVSQVSKDWKKAEDKVERGEKLVREGNTQIRKGNDQQAKGASEERAATRELEDYRSQYDLAVLSVGSATTADQAEEQGRRLRALEKRVKSTEDDLKDARAKQKRGRENVEDGRAKIKKGERLVAEGEAEMKAIEADYRGLAASAR